MDKTSQMKTELTFEMVSTNEAQQDLLKERDCTGVCTYLHLAQSRKGFNFHGDQRLWS